ncbi:MAG: trypsin-like peptidase domain-containing protein, partial [Bacteroidota bacterium]
KWIGTFFVAALGAAMGVGAMQLLDTDQPQAAVTQAPAPVQPAMQVVNPVARTSTGANVVENPDFVHASAQATPAVVHIKSYFERSGGGSDPFGGLFGDPFHGGNRPQASGSGVIISGDGYIATNNHVIRNADKVEVILEDKRSFIAEVVGTDPTTDLALLKIEENGLTHLGFGNSDAVQIGEWVLAVGNPFNLTSTVTAGIVSAKGRSLNLLNEEFAIESFIQTDAAVNPGNSGGALINTNGELVGINTAIASETGSYAGYSFAVPANIVAKVMKDLEEFGEVQRGIIGVQIRNINAQFAEENDLGTLYGAFVTGTIPGGAAESAGIKSGDVIDRVGDADVKSASELQEVIGTYRPGDKVRLRVVRAKKQVMIDVTLRDRNGRTSLGERRSESGSERGIARAASPLGADLEQITYKEKTDLGLESGVKVAGITDGMLKEAGVNEGFIITRVNKQYVETPGEVEKIVGDTDGSILIEGLTLEGERKFYAFEQ